MAVGSSLPISTWGYANVASATSTQVKTGSGQLHALVVSKTAAGAISVIDGTADGDPTIGTLKASIAEGSYLFDCDFATGLRLVTAGASDVTVVYR